MFCSYCGTKLAEDVAFCSNCGEATKPKITQEQTQIVNVETQTVGTSAIGTFWGLFLFFIVLPIGSCVACGMCGAAGSSSNKDGGVVALALVGLCIVVWMAVQAKHNK
jgi:hypothetical protein